MSDNDRRGPGVVERRHVKVLRERLDHLSKRIKAADDASARSGKPRQALTYDRAERAALVWALSRLDAPANPNEVTGR